MNLWKRKHGHPSGLSTSVWDLWDGIILTRTQLFFRLGRRSWSM
jgi:hypothetical protein